MQNKTLVFMHFHELNEGSLCEFAKIQSATGGGD